MKYAHQLRHLVGSSLSDIQAIINKTKNKTVILDFYADWCASCKVMEETTFQDPSVIQALKKIVLLKVDITSYSRQDKVILNHYNVTAPPTFLFFDKQGNEINSLRIVGEIGSKAFLKQLRKYQNYLQSNANKGTTTVILRVTSIDFFGNHVPIRL